MRLPAKGRASLIAILFLLAPAQKAQPSLFTASSCEVGSMNLLRMRTRRTLNLITWATRVYTFSIPLPQTASISLEIKDAVTRAMKLLQYIRVFLGRSAVQTPWRAPVRHNGSTGSLWRRLAASKLSGQGAKFLFKVSYNSLAVYRSG